MKLLLSFCAVLFCSSTLLRAQVTESDKTMSAGTKNGLSLDIKNVTIKSVEKEWKRFIKEFKKDDDKYGCRKTLWHVIKN